MNAANNSSNATVPTVGVVEDAHPVFWLVVLVILTVLFIIGVIANILILVVVKRTPSMHSVTNVLLCNLAVSDLVTILWPLVSVGVFHLMSAQKPPLGNFCCKFIVSIPSITFVSAILTLSLIAVARYGALVNTMLPTLHPTLESVKYFILVIWTIGLVDAIPLFVFLKFDGPRKHCYFANESREITKALTITGIIVIIILPLTIISYCYSKIIYGIYISKTILSRNSSGNEEVQMKRKLVRTSILVTIAVVLCYAPEGITAILYVLEVFSEEFFNKRTRVVLYLFSYIKPIINPFLYAFQSANYRAVVKSLCCCCYPRKVQPTKPRKNQTLSQFEIKTQSV